MADMPLEQIVRDTAEKADQKKIFNNAAQTWNHTFFWNCLRAPARGQPSGSLAQRIEKDLGGLDKFKQQFSQAAIDTFGSGWAWLVDRNGKLEIASTSNAMTPLAQGATPILTIDVWEHAYYVDYENRRPEFVNAVIERVLNWDFAQEQLDRSSQRKAA
jgi:Fe-Mn family superoxide dismutase